MISICFFNSAADDESSDEFFAAILFIFVCSALYKLNRLYLIHLRKFVFVFNFQKEPTVSAEGIFARRANTRGAPPVLCATLAPMGRVNPLGLLPVY